MAVRSGRLAAVSIDTAGFTALVTVQPGYAVIVKSIDVTNASNAGAKVNLYLSSAGVTTTFLTVDVPATLSATWEGWRALSEGDQLYINVDQVPFRVYVSGATLPNV